MSIVSPSSIDIQNDLLDVTSKGISHNNKTIYLKLSNERTNYFLLLIFDQLTNRIFIFLPIFTIIFPSYFVVPRIQ